MIFDFTGEVTKGDTVSSPSQQVIEATPVLRQAGLEKAVIYGGPAVRALLETAPVVGDRKHIVVDTKTTMLMPGWLPAIPGWHTDGVPRPDKKPRLDLQEGDGPRYHLVTVGLDNPTEFVSESLSIDLENYDNADLYAELTRKIEALQPETVSYHERWVSWSWWNIHRATTATDRGWRLLIRVTESDDLPPRSTGFLRAQSQVYVPTTFGW